MANAYAQNAYKTNSIQSLTPGEQVARLLETAAKHIMRAKTHAEKKEFELRLNATEDALKIITGLQGCLQYNDLTNDIAAVLQNYYATLTLQIGRINIQNDLTMCDTVVQSLRTMARTWRETEAKARQESASAMPMHAATGSVDVAAC